MQQREENLILRFDPKLSLKTSLWGFKAMLLKSNTYLQGLGNERKA